MQPTNKAKPFLKPRCIYCGATYRGKGCRYAPYGVHFFPDDPKKCAYCGSTSYGRGCRVNPTCDLHVHGINYNSMFKEEVQSFLDFRILLRELKRDFKEFEAFKLGIIDDAGNKIKEPETIVEKAAYSSTAKQLLRLKRYLGVKVDLMHHTCNLSESSRYHLDSAFYKKRLEYRDKMFENINQLYQTMDEALQEGLSYEEVIGLLKA